MNGAEWQLTTLVEDDLDEVVQLEQICFADAWSRASFQEEALRVEEGGYPRVLRIGGLLVAYMIAWYVLDEAHLSDEAHLANLAVRPEHRGRGCGRLLLEDFLREGRLRGCRMALLEVRVGNEAAIRLYRACGFQEVAVRKNYYQSQHEDALVMARAIEGGEEPRDGVSV